MLSQVAYIFRPCLVKDYNLDYKPDWLHRDHYRVVLFFFIPLMLTYDISELENSGKPSSPIALSATPEASLRITRCHVHDALNRPRSRPRRGKPHSRDSTTHAILPRPLS